MKFISRGAVRIGTRGKDKPCWHAAFQNPDGSKVLVLAHPGAKEEEANVLWNGLEMRLLLPPKSVMTLRWR